MEARERLLHSIIAYLRAINNKIILAAIVAVLCLLSAGATGFLLLKEEKITFGYLSIITAINFCLGIYNVLIIPSLLAQRITLKSELSELENYDYTNLN